MNSSRAWLFTILKCKNNVCPPVLFGYYGSASHTARLPDVQLRTVVKVISSKNMSKKSIAHEWYVCGPRRIPFQQYKIHNEGNQNQTKKKRKRINMKGKKLVKLWNFNYISGNETILRGQFFTALPNFGFYLLEVEQRLAKGINCKALRKPAIIVRWIQSFKWRVPFLSLEFMRPIWRKANNIFKKWKTNKGLWLWSCPNQHEHASKIQGSCRPSYKKKEWPI